MERTEAGAGDRAAGAGARGRGRAAGAVAPESSAQVAGRGGDARGAAWRARLLARAPGAGRAQALGSPPELPRDPRVLLIRPDHLGDLLLSGPALARLRAAWPGARITWLVGPWSAPLAERLPGADAVETLDFPWFNRKPKGAPWRPYLRLLRASRRLRGRFDLAIVLREDDGWGAWLAALAGIPLRVAHDRPGPRPFATHLLPAERCPQHAAAGALALVAALAGGGEERWDFRRDPLVLRLRDEDREAAARLLAPLGEGGGALGPGPIAIHPGSGSALKRWPSAAWGELIRALAAPGETVVLTGGPDERALTAAIAAGARRPVLDLAGRTELGALAALLARCRLVLGPDSGPLHLAVALGRPSVHLFGPAAAERFGPWGDPGRHRVLAAGLPCAPCGRLDWPDPGDHPCLRLIEPARVIAAARSCGAPAPNL